MWTTVLPISLTSTGRTGLWSSHLKWGLWTGVFQLLTRWPTARDLFSWMGRMSLALAFHVATQSTNYHKNQYCFAAIETISYSDGHVYPTISLSVTGVKAEFKLWATTGTTSTAPRLRTGSIARLITAVAGLQLIQLLVEWSLQTAIGGGILSWTLV